jgi:MFS family permease
MSAHSAVLSPPVAPLTATGRWLVVIVAFLGWLCCGVHMSITQLVSQPAAYDLLYHKAVRMSDPTPQTRIVREATAARWFAWGQCAFLFGAATGGWLFGRLGDRIGRSKAMAASILTYSSMAAVTGLSQSPIQYCAAWYLACTGVGGMWPNGVALVSEVWDTWSRAAVAGVIGTAANIGLFVFAAVASLIAITPDHWRWTMAVGAAPVVLGVVALLVVPESPRWLALQAKANDTAIFDPATRPGHTAAGRISVFRSPYLGVTILAIVLATVPMIGGWGTANWMNPWADKAGAALDPPNPHLKAYVGLIRALVGILGSVLGGWIATVVGRRTTYFLVSLASLMIAQYIFWFLTPTDASFLFWVGVLGFVSGIYFGWLPLCLPELFPTRVRSTGAGVGFNFGRIVTAVTLFIGGALLTFFASDYAAIGRITSWLFVVGMVAICFAPDTSRRQLTD